MKWKWKVRIKEVIQSENVMLKDKGTVPLFEQLWNDLRSNEMFVQYFKFWKNERLYFLEFLPPERKA